MKFLRNGKVLTAISFLLLIALIWFVGPFMGLETSVSRMVAIFVVMLVWVMTLMIGKLVADRAGSLLERMLRKQADDAVMEFVRDGGQYRRWLGENFLVAESQEAVAQRFKVVGASLVVFYLFGFLMNAAIGLDD